MTLRFGTDGIRGVANRELTPELVTALGRAAARTLGTEQPFIVGRDTRRSGPMIEECLAKAAYEILPGGQMHLFSADTGQQRLNRLAADNRRPRRYRGRCTPTGVPTKASSEWGTA